MKNFFFFPIFPIKQKIRTFHQSVKISDYLCLMGKGEFISEQSSSRLLRRVHTLPLGAFINALLEFTLQTFCFVKKKNKKSKRTLTLFMSGLSKKDVFADIYGSFEPTKVGVLQIFISIILGFIWILLYYIYIRNKYSTDCTAIV